MKTINSIREKEVEKIILKSEPQVFEVIFDTKSNPGVLRHMKCVNGVRYKKKSDTKGRAAEDHAKKLLTVFDIEVMEKNRVGGFRRINLAGVRQIKINGEQFDVV